jgi:hypothetical protein
MVWHEAVCCLHEANQCEKAGRYRCCITPSEYSILLKNHETYKEMDTARSSMYTRLGYMFQPLH